MSVDMEIDPPKYKKTDLSRKGLNRIPADILQKADSVLNLDLSSNWRVDLADDLRNFTNVRELSLSCCDLNEIPKALTCLSKLETLDLSGNALETFPTTLASLAGLKQLKLRVCELSSVPDETVKLSLLEVLDLSGNSLCNFPLALTLLASLKQLILRVCNLSSLPDEICRLSQLEKLDIHGNGSMRSLPLTIGQLLRLKDLDISDCDLLELPDTVKLLTCLERLQLARNYSMTSLRPAIGELHKLSILDISNCDLLRLPDSVGQLACLTELRIGNNRLQTYPDVTLHLRKLLVLDLSNEKKSSVGNENIIRELPAQVIDTSLMVLNLNGNPMIMPPSEVCEQGLDAIRIYFRDIIPGQELLCADTINMLGETGAGKTSIARSLQSCRPSPAGADDRTRVMDQLRAKIGNKFVNINDFGGHGVYQTAVSIFLSSNGLSLVAVNISEKLASLDIQKEQVRKWIMTVLAKSKSIRVIVVGTHSDEIDSHRRKAIEKEMDEHIRLVCSSAKSEIKSHINGLQCQQLSEQRLESLKESLAIVSSADISFVTLSCKDPDPDGGLDKLYSLVEKKLKPSAVTPASWCHVMKAIKNHQIDDEGGRPYLEWKEVLGNLARYLSPENCEATVKVILRYLASASQVLWFEESPRLSQVVFHQPQHIVDLCKKVLHHHRNPELRSTLGEHFYDTSMADYEQGFLHKTFLAQLLGSGNMVEVMSELMQQFHLISAIDDNRYAVTSNLSIEPPPKLTEWVHESTYVRSSIQIQLSFIGQCIPVAFFESNLALILSWVCSRKAEPAIWKDGIIFGMNLVCLTMRRIGSVLEIVAFTRSENVGIWSVLQPLLERIYNNVTDLWTGAQPLCKIICPGCRRLAQRWARPGSRHTTLDELVRHELARDDLMSLSSIWYCHECDQHIPGSLMFPTRKEHEETLSPSVQDREVVAIERKFRKARDLLISQLDVTTILDAADVLYAKEVITESQYEEIEEQARKGERKSAVRRFVSVVTRCGGSAIMALLAFLESDAAGNRRLVDDIRGIEIN